MNRQQRRPDGALQRRREEAHFGRNRLAELLPRAAALAGGTPPPLAPPQRVLTELLLAGFTAADIRGAYTYYSGGGGWHGDVTLSFEVEGVGNRIGTAAAVPCATEAAAEEVAVGLLGALLLEAERIAAMPPDERRLQAIAGRAAIGKWTGDPSWIEGLAPDEVEDLLLAGEPPEARAAKKEELRKLRALPPDEMWRRLDEMERDGLA